MIFFLDKYGPFLVRFVVGLLGLLIREVKYGPFIDLNFEVEHKILTIWIIM